MFAVVAKRAELVRALLDAGADPRVTVRKANVRFGVRKDMPLLHLACAMHVRRSPPVSATARGALCPG